MILFIFYHRRNLFFRLFFTLSKIESFLLKKQFSPFVFFSQVFIFGGNSASYVPFRFVILQYILCLYIYTGIYFFKPFCNIFMYGRFGNTELFCGCSDRSLVFYNVFSKLNGSFLYRFVQNIAS